MSELRVADTARALFDATAWFAEYGPGGWVERDGDAAVAVTRFPVPTLNGVWLPRGIGGDAALVSSRLERVASEGVAYCLQFPVGDEEGRRIAETHGMLREDDIPLMRLDREPPRVVPGGVAVRRLPPEESWRHGELAAAGFEVPEAVLAPFVAPGVASRPEIRYYVGEADGEPVVTGMGLLIGGRLGVWDIGTPPEHRRRGYGSAITAAIALDGFAAGADWCWLQSSTAGAPVYAALGFQVVATWECWIGE